jgi:hypothetical protein
MVELATTLAAKLLSVPRTRCNTRPRALEGHVNMRA